MNTLREIAESLAEGEQVRITCPFCLAKDEQSMRVQGHSAVVAYLCFRSKCGKKGILARSGRALRPAPKIEDSRPFKHSLAPLPTEVWEQLLKPYLPEEVCNEEGMRFIPSMNRVYMPVYNYAGYEIAAMAKAVVKGTKPKVIAYYDTKPGLLAHFPRCNRSTGPLVLVEDQISATKVGLVARGCALLSTHIPDNLVKFLVKQQEHDVRIMLDDNATNVAYAAERKYRGLFRNLSVIPLSIGDPKDIPLDELKDMLL